MHCALQYRNHQTIITLCQADAVAAKANQQARYADFNHICLKSMICMFLLLQHSTARPKLCMRTRHAAIAFLIMCICTMHGISLEVYPVNNIRRWMKPGSYWSSAEATNKKQTISDEQADDIIQRWQQQQQVQTRDNDDDNESSSADASEPEEETACSENAAAEASSDEEQSSNGEASEQEDEAKDSDGNSAPAAESGASEPADETDGSEIDESESSDDGLDSEEDSGSEPPSSSEEAGLLRIDPHITHLVFHSSCSTLAQLTEGMQICTSILSLYIYVY